MSLNLSHRFGRVEQVLRVEYAASSGANRSECGAQALALSERTYVCVVFWDEGLLGQVGLRVDVRAGDRFALVCHRDQQLLDWNLTTRRWRARSDVFFGNRVVNELGSAVKEVDTSHASIMMKGRAIVENTFKKLAAKLLQPRLNRAAFAYMRALEDTEMSKQTGAGSGKGKLPCSLTEV